MKAERHQLVAVGIWAAVCGVLAIRDGLGEQTLGKMLALFVVLLPILIYRVIAWLSSFGFPEVFARDYGSRSAPGPYAFFFWIIFLIVCAFLLFRWSLW